METRDFFRNHVDQMTFECAEILITFAQQSKKQNETNCTYLIRQNKTKTFDQWMKIYINFYKKYNRQPRNSIKEEFSLSNWVRKIRNKLLHKKITLKKEHIKALKENGFVFVLNKKYSKRQISSEFVQTFV